MEDLSRYSVEQIEKEMANCLSEIKHAKKLKRRPTDYAARFNLLTRELNSRSGK